MATNNAINNAGNSFLVPANNLSDLSTVATANNNLNAVQSIAVVTNIGNASWGKTMVCTGAASYGINITGTHVANQWIRFSIQTTSNAIVSIASAIGGTINGQSTILLGSGDCVMLWDDGTNYWVIAEVLQPVRFVAYRNAAQSIPNGANTEIVYNVAPVNLGGFFNTATGRFTPLVPGVYQFNWSAIFLTGSTAYTQNTKPFLNAATQLGQTQFIPAITGQNMTHSGSQQQYFNGSTDFLSIWALQNSGGAISINGDATPTYVTSFNAVRVSLF